MLNRVNLYRDYFDNSTESDLKRCHFFILNSFPYFDDLKIVWFDLEDVEWLDKTMPFETKQIIGDGRLWSKQVKYAQNINQNEFVVFVVLLLCFQNRLMYNDFNI